MVGKRLGTATLGAYNLGWTLASIPVDRVAGLVAQVTPAVFSAVQTQPRRIATLSAPGSVKGWPSSHSRLSDWTGARCRSVRCGVPGGQVVAGDRPAGIARLLCRRRGR